MTNSNGGLHATATFYFPYGSQDLDSMRRAKLIFQDVLDFAQERGGVECAVEYSSDRLWLKAETEQPATAKTAIDAVIVRADEKFLEPADVAELTDIPAVLRRTVGDTP